MAHAVLQGRPTKEKASGRRGARAVLLLCQSENTMTDIAIRKHNENKPTVVAERAGDPWRTMRSLLSWDPFREIESFPRLDESVLPNSPAFEVKETKDAYQFKADVPGVQDKDLEVSITGKRLTVSGKREAEKEDRGDRYYTYERSYGSFTRSFSLPDGADTDKIQAALDKGVLSLNVPKKAEVQAKKIAVKTEGSTNKS
jgi:HSP20 family protein